MSCLKYFYLYPVVSGYIYSCIWLTRPTKYYNIWIMVLTCFHCDSMYLHPGQSGYIDRGCNNKSIDLILSNSDSIMVLCMFSRWHSNQIKVPTQADCKNNSVYIIEARGSWILTVFYITHNYSVHRSCWRNVWFVLLFTCCSYRLTNYSVNLQIVAMLLTWMAII